MGSEIFHTYMHYTFPVSTPSSNEQSHLAFAPVNSKVELHSIRLSK